MLPNQNAEQIPVTTLGFIWRYSEDIPVPVGRTIN